MKTLYAIFILLVFPLLLFAQKEINIKSGSNIIHLTIFGKGDPILIINGGPGMHSEGFKPLAKILGESHKAIIYDQRGTGKSTLSKVDTNTVTLDSMVADIEVIREELGIENWVILGHSFGGMLASYYATKHPQRVKGLILSSSGGINMELFRTVNVTARLTENQRDSLNYWRTEIANGDTTFYAQLQKAKYLAPAYLYDQAHAPVVANRLTQADLGINRLVFQNMRKINFDCTEELKTFEAPVLIIQGKQDVIGSDIAEIAHHAFQNSTVVYMDKCGHYGWLDRPDLYFKEINNFLARLDKEDVVTDK